MTSYWAAWMVATMSPSSPEAGAAQGVEQGVGEHGLGLRPLAMASARSRNTRSSISRIWLPVQRNSRRASRPSGWSGVAV